MTNGSWWRTRRRLPWGVVGVAALIGALSVGRGTPDADAAQAAAVYPLVFPLAGTYTLTDSFGDPRGRGRRHAGVDILADRMTPVLAAADGTVRWLKDERGGDCCDVALLHDDGWRSRYIHLNNDTPGTDDGRAVGIAPGIRKGARVVAGQVIGWVGDSGNAEATVPHLHFELRRPDGTPVDPLPSLKAALERGRELAPGATSEAPPAPAGEAERESGVWRYLLGNRHEPEPDGEAGTGTGSGAAGRGEGGTGAVVEGGGLAGPAVPGATAEPVREEVETAVHPPGSFPDLSMDRRVEEVPVPATAKTPPRRPRSDSLRLLRVRAAGLLAAGLLTVRPLGPGRRRGARRRARTPGGLRGSLRPTAWSPLASPSPPAPPPARARAARCRPPRWRRRPAGRPGSGGRRTNAGRGRCALRRRCRGRGGGGVGHGFGFLVWWGPVS